MGDKKAYRGIGMEGWIASLYVRITEKDMAEFRKLADRLTGDVPPDGRILEVAPGPGFLAIEFAKRGRFEITGLDISRSFVEIAAEQARKQGVIVDFQQGDASAMPFNDDTFNLVVCRAAFKNFSRPLQALDEMFRVLKKGGRAVVIDLRRDVAFGEIAAYVDKMGLGTINRIITKLTFRYMLVPRAYSMDDFRKMASRSKFKGCDIDDYPIGMEVVLKK
jgi:ubiquinone/menaquinone biosynthesis C-methylase UbiE